MEFSFRPLPVSFHPLFPSTPYLLNLAMTSEERVHAEYIPTSSKIPAVTMVGPTVLGVTDLEGHPRSMTFISSEREYATSY